MTDHSPTVPVRAIERIDARDERAASLLARQQPLVLLSAAAGWPAMTRWTPDYLKSKVSDCPISAAKLDRARPEIVDPVEMTFHRLVDHAWATDSASERISMQAKLIGFDGRPDPLLGALAEDISVPAIVPRDRLSSAGFWLGVGGYVNPIHYDPNGCSNLNVQVTGRKRAVLISPDQTSRMYLPRKIAEPGAVETFPAFDAAAPDPSRVPLFAGAQQWETVLEPGEALYIPPFWYHLIFHLDPVNINVNFWYLDTIQLSGLTVRWAFLNALARLGPSNELPAAIESLSPDARRVLEQLEEIMLTEDDVVTRWWPFVARRP